MAALPDKPARPDLCGGRSAMSVPTANAEATSEQSDEDGRLSIRQCPDEAYADDGNRGEMCRSRKLRPARSGRPTTLQHGMLVKGLIPVTNCLYPGAHDRK